VDQPGRRAGKRRSENGRPRGVDPIGGVLVGFRRVYRGVGGRVDNDVRPDVRDHAGDRRRVGDVEVGAAQRMHILAGQGGTEVRPELATGPCDQPARPIAH